MKCKRKCPKWQNDKKNSRSFLTRWAKPLPLILDKADKTPPAHFWQGGQNPSRSFLTRRTKPLPLIFDKADKTHPWIFKGGHYPPVFFTTRTKETLIFVQGRTEHPKHKLLYLCVCVCLHSKKNNIKKRKRSIVRAIIHVQSYRKFPK